MTSLVGIYNEALTILRAERIQAESESNGQHMAAVWPTVRDATLRRHPWNFAIARASLAVDSVAPAFGWARAFTLPTNPYCLRVLRIADSPKATFEVEGRKILTDEAAPLKVQFISRVTDPTVYDAAFVEAAALQIAAKTAFAITGSRALAARLGDEAKAATKGARGADGQETGAREALDSEFIDSRN